MIPGRDPDLFATYVEQRDSLARFFWARLGPGADVDDLLQDLYLKLAGMPPAPVAEPKAYLFRLASNLMTDRWRASTRGAARDGAWLAVAGGDADGSDDAPTAETILAGKQRLAALMATLDRLPERTRTVFRLHKFDELSHAEVALRLGISRSSVEKHMMEALRALMKGARP